MSRFARLDVLNTIVAQGLVPVFYHGDPEIVKQVIKASYAGGEQLFEFTNRGDHAPFVFQEVSAWAAKELPDVILGVGSVVDAPTAALYAAAGAAFVVGPNTNPEVARFCNRRKIAYSPGCGTATEIAQAEELGVEIVKIFPGETVGGPDFVKAILAPCPWTRIMPTGGVDPTAESIQAWFKAGVAAVGIGSKLITKQAIQAGDWDSISRTVAQTLALIAAARKK
jgi:2-dehydro-3-deoxyphosphogluconate aldolase/(4S)-4-hydroxy-2-oxoglutarate aldolase